MALIGITSLFADFTYGAAPQRQQPVPCLPRGLCDRGGLVAQILTTAKKATAFGIYDTGHGAFWLSGSWLMGYLYSPSLDTLVIFSLGTQLVSLPIFWLTYWRKPQSR